MKKEPAETQVISKLIKEDSLVSFSDTTKPGELKKYSSDPKARLQILSEQLLSLDKAIATDGVYEQVKNLLESQKKVTLSALLNNAVCLKPDWLIESKGMLQTMSTGLVEKDHFDSLLEKALGFVKDRETTFLERIIALPGYDLLKQHITLKTESDFLEQTSETFEQVIKENQQVIQYAADYSDYMRKMRTYLEENEKTFFALKKNLKESLEQIKKESSSSGTEGEDKEVLTCLEKAVALEYPVEEEDLELAEIIKKSASSTENLPKESKEITLNTKQKITEYPGILLSDSGTEKESMKGKSRQSIKMDLS
jgi:hypothetical protein